ncbi:MAG: TPM domain-containing protein [Candidatus Omnitrophica bacterium]|nr:TPM domain-containing protein [Candidatus Omnitrophota bacterium]MBU4488058.1 TPM domain-containing protein [Candidatus Omnitrophota bacterium]MCG2704849.1 TPM domain-containing protein [Candidatus Omnitrophota bacterium]
MKKVFVFCVVVSIFVLSAGSGFAKIEIPGRASTWVNDYAGIIDKDTKAYLEQLCGSVEQKTSDPIEVIVATFRSLGGWDLRDFTTEYGEKWREAKKGRRDNGVILLVVMDTQQVTIGVGQNLRHIVTQKTIEDIVQNTIVPEFKKNNYAGGIKKGTEAIVSILNKADIPANKPITGAKLIALLVLIGIGLIIIRGLLKKGVSA